ncbi:dna-binding protein hbsu [hydrocarbon metagenome]|uniref:Dna-binding protein hbsu n=1 Tax=hydrocarbon metagenome TaxID=938273 RepID=A0A0W8E8X2_9ZZZZ
MNKNGLIDAIATQLSKSKDGTEAFINTFIDVVSAEIARGNRVQLTGFGTFERRLQTAREGRNPRTGESLQIPAKYHPVFKAGKAFKDLCN